MFTFQKHVLFWMHKRLQTGEALLETVYSWGSAAPAQAESALSSLGSNSQAQPVCSCGQFCPRHYWDCLFPVWRLKLMTNRWKLMTRRYFSSRFDSWCWMKQFFLVCVSVLFSPFGKVVRTSYMIITLTAVGVGAPEHLNFLKGSWWFMVQIVGHLSCPTRYLITQLLTPESWHLEYDSESDCWLPFSTSQLGTAWDSNLQITLPDMLGHMLSILCCFFLSKPMR